MDTPILGGAPPVTHANLLIDNLEERLEAARRVQNLIRQALPIQLPIMNKVANQNVENFRMELIHLSAFLFADMRHVRSVVRDPRHSTVFESVMTMEAFLGIFLQRKSHQMNPVDFRKSQGTKPESPEVYQPRSCERNKAFQRDNERCVFSHVPEAEVAHIWPFGINDTEGTFYNTDDCFTRCLILMETSVERQLHTLLADPGSGWLGQSDRPWNMVTVSPDIQAHWENAHFGLKWHDSIGHEKVVNDGEETEYTIFRVQWHWLPAHIVDSLGSRLITRQDEPLAPKRLVQLDTPEDITAIANAINEATTSSQHLSSTEQPVLKDHEGRAIETGRLFTLKVDRRDEDKMKAVIDTQWLAVQMAAFSGAADVVGKLDRECSKGPRLARMVAKCHYERAESSEPEV